MTNSIRRRIVEDFSVLVCAVSEMNQEMYMRGLAFNRTESDSRPGLDNLVIKAPG